jgi:hypothetical protein
MTNRFRTNHGFEITNQLWSSILLPFESELGCFLSFQIYCNFVEADCSFCSLITAIVCLSLLEKWLGCACNSSETHAESSG